jgi:plastocyanin
VTVDAGETVEWINRDAAPHTATADGDAFDSGNLDRGGRFAKRMSRPGEYPYICAIHPDMRGVVRVRRRG